MLSKALEKLMKTPDPEGQPSDEDALPSPLVEPCQERLFYEEWVSHNGDSYIIAKNAQGEVVWDTIPWQLKYC